MNKYRSACNPMTIRCFLAALLCVTSVTLADAGLIRNDFEDGQRPDAQPMGADGVAPPFNSELVASEIVGSRENQAGRGQGLRLHDNNSRERVAVEWNIGGSPDDSVSVARFTFDFAPGSGNLGDPNESIIFSGMNHSHETVHGRTAENRLFMVHLNGDETVDVRIRKGEESVGHRIRRGVNQIAVFVNDHDEKKLEFLNPETDRADEIDANSVVFYLNDKELLRTSLYLSQPVTGGNIGNTENNFGRYGFTTLGKTTGVDYVIDNVTVFTAD